MLVTFPYIMRSEANHAGNRCGCFDCDDPWCFGECCEPEGEFA